LAAKNVLQPGIQAEVRSDTARIDRWLGGGHKHSSPGTAQGLEGVPDAGVGRVLVEADVAESLTVEGHGAGGQRVDAVEQIDKAAVQGRADPAQQLLLRWSATIEPVQGIPDAARDPFLGVGQGAVKIKKNMHFSRNRSGFSIYSSVLCRQSAGRAECL